MKKFYFTLVTFLFLAVANAQIVNIPDANFKAKLLLASPSISVASVESPVYNTSTNTGTVSSYNKIDTNNDGEIQVSEAIQIKFLKIDSANISSLEGISSFVNLKLLKCVNNQLTNLDVSSLSNLEFLFCYQNDITTLNVSGLTNLKYFDCATNLLTSLDITNLNNLIELGFAANQVESINVTGLINLKELVCNNNELNYIDVSNCVNLETLICSENPLTTLLMKNGIQETNLFIPNGSYYICCDEFQRNQIQSSYCQNCEVNSYCSFEPGGNYYNIEGNSYFDYNSNGCDVLDYSFKNLKYALSNGPINLYSTPSDSGEYNIPLQTGTYIVSPQLENPTYFTISPTSASVTLPAAVNPFTQNFCVVPNGVYHDLEVVVIPLFFARPGFDVLYKIKYKNKGNQTENATISFNYNDAILDFVSANVSPTSQATGTLSWNVGAITPFQSGEILVTLNVNSPTETPAVNGGDILSYTATANGLDTDETPDDNTFTLSQQVFNSFDPNDKTCLEGAIINPSNIGKYVHYKIRFENTGTFAAQNIVVKDMIDTTKFDLATLQMTDASHSCVTRITNPNKVEFIFENINLPFDDATNDGYVVFKIKTKPTLVVGNIISNSANIYFDYNFPIVTNTATSTFSVLQNDTFEFDNYFTIYPNPVDEVLNLTTKQETEVYSLTIYNLLGQQVQTTTNPNDTVDVSSLKTGNYIVKVLTDKGVSSSKFMKE